jgi:hypothetical protein
MPMEADKALDRIGHDTCLCRARHKSDYAASWIMPSGPDDGGSRSAIACSLPFAVPA